MSALAALPLVEPHFRLQTGEDWLDAVSFSTDDGAPIDVSDIAFALNVYPRGSDTPALSASTGAGSILVAGNVLSLDVPAGEMAALAPGAYRVEMSGSAEGQTRALFAGRLTMVRA